MYYDAVKDNGADMVRIYNVYCLPTLLRFSAEEDAIRVCDMSMIYFGNLAIPTLAM